MPCAALPRGGRVTLTFPASPPMDFTPINAKAHIPPYNDAIQNNPCGAKRLMSVGGVDVSAQNLCIFHWAMVNGQAALVAPLVIEP